MRINFKDPATAVMEGIIDFHHDVQVYLIIIVTFVGWVLFRLVYEFGIMMIFRKPDEDEETVIQKKIELFEQIHTKLHNINPQIAKIFMPVLVNLDKIRIQIFNFVMSKTEDEKIHVFKNRKHSLITKSVTHGVILEIVWTLLPVFVLIAIAIPSFALLYSIDEIIDPTLTIKVIGHQWYWSYEYTDYENEKLLFDSYMIPENDLQLGNLRLLEVDRKVWLPINTHIRVLITANDVLHSWAIPSFGVKMDAVPGRLNQVSLFIKREGLFYGQCSELCGVNHGFMPIVVKAVPISLFTTWINFLVNKENI